MSSNDFLGKLGILGHMSTPITEVLAANMRRLMDKHADLNTQAKVGAAAGVNQKTISNCLNPSQRHAGTSGRTPSPTLAQVEKIAGAFGLEVWELLRPAKR